MTTTNTKQDRPNAVTKPRRAWLGKLKPGEWIAISLIVAGTAGVLILFFRFRVCDEQAAGNGKLELVCRHLQLEDPPIAAIGLIMLATLGIFFSEVSGFGFTLKSRVEEAKRDANQATEKAGEAREQASLARREARDALLASRYNHIRAEFPPGGDRDKLMKDLWEEMIEEFKGETNFDVTAHLRNPRDEGMRLAGYAYLHAHPNVEMLSELATITLSDSKPFNQEMGLRTLRVLLRDRCELLDDNLRTRLEKKAASLRIETKAKGRSSKRVVEIEAILDQCPDPSRASLPTNLDTS